MSQKEDLFPPKPTHWGLRGDPHLWDDLQTAMDSAGPFDSRDAFEITLEMKFAQLIKNHGSQTEEARVWLSKYSKDDGMSDGWISLDWWKSIGLPLIKSSFGK